MLADLSREWSALLMLTDNLVRRGVGKNGSLRMFDALARNTLASGMRVTHGRLIAKLICTSCVRYKTIVNPRADEASTNASTSSGINLRRLWDEKLSRLSLGTFLGGR
jgi:hypothetical protein